MPKQSQVLPVLAVAAFMASLDLFIVNVAFDDIGRDFAGSSLADLSWILNAYAILYAALLVPLGRLADRYGQKAGFLAGLALFTVGSAACAASPGLAALIAGVGVTGGIALADEDIGARPFEQHEGEIFSAHHRHTSRSTLPAPTTPLAARHAFSTFAGAFTVAG